MASGPQIMLSAPMYSAHSESLPVSCRFFPRATAQPPPGRCLGRFPCGRPSKSSSEVKTVSGSFTGIRPVIVRLTGTINSTEVVSDADRNPRHSGVVWLGSAAGCTTNYG